MPSPAPSLPPPLPPFRPSAPALPPAPPTSPCTSSSLCPSGYHPVSQNLAGGMPRNEGLYADTCTIEGCAALCASRNDCVAFEWRNANHLSEAHDCWTLIDVVSVPSNMGWPEVALIDSAGLVPIFAWPPQEEFTQACVLAHTATVSPNCSLFPGEAIFPCFSWHSCWHSWHPWHSCWHSWHSWILAFWAKLIAL
jgi:hypothetical protein